MPPEFLRLAVITLGGMLIFFVATPMIGAAILVNALPKGGLPAMPYSKALTAFYYAAAISFVVLLLTSFATAGLDESTDRAIRVGISLAVHLAFVPSYLKLFSPPKAFLVAAAAILLANVLAIMLLQSLASILPPANEPVRPSPEGEASATMSP